MKKKLLLQKMPGSQPRTKEAKIRNNYAYNSTAHKARTNQKSQEIKIPGAKRLPPEKRRMLTSKDYDSQEAEFGAA